MGDDDGDEDDEVPLEPNAGPQTMSDSEDEEEEEPKVMNACTNKYDGVDFVHLFKVRYFRGQKGRLALVRF